MNLSKLLPMMATGGVAYTQQDTIAVMVEAPVEAAQIVRCQMEVASIQRILIIDTLTDEIGRDLEPRFSEYLRNKLISTGGRDTSLDPWGNPYRVQVRSAEIEVWSYGPDGIDNNSDDLWAVVPLR